MRNRFAGICYRCRGNVAIGEGYFERHGHGWRTQHVVCSKNAKIEKDNQVFGKSEQLLSRENPTLASQWGATELEKK